MKDVVCAYSACYKGKGGRRHRANHLCPHCHSVGYCCLDCRTKDWAHHRKICLTLQKEDCRKNHSYHGHHGYRGHHGYQGHHGHRGHGDCHDHHNYCYDNYHGCDYTYDFGHGSGYGHGHGYTNGCHPNYCKCCCCLRVVRKQTVTGKHCYKQF